MAASIPSEPAAEAEPKPARSLRPLRMIWRATAVYPGRVAIAFAALVTTATATLGIPWGFRQIIDKGFAKGADPEAIQLWFMALIGIVGVLALGGVTLFAAQFILPETLFPWLSITSGLLVVAIGVVMVRERGRAFLSGNTHFGHSHHSHGHALHSMHAHQHVHDDHGHAHHEHTHHQHSHDGAHSHGHAAHVHRHAHPHSHLPPGADGSPVTWRSLLALGVSGGLLPCPSALVLMLGAISVQRVAFGLALIVMFSLGLASVLTAIGIVLVYAGQFFRRIPEGGPIFRFVPVASALFITVAGVGITLQSLMQFGLLPLS